MKINNNVVALFNYVIKEDIIFYKSVIKKFIYRGGLIIEGFIL